MKTYFTKYLPVEGEINPEERYIHSLTTEIHINTDITPIDHPDYKKVKLFLCSRDIKVGDKVQEIFSDNTLSKVYSLGKLPNREDILLLYDGKMHHQATSKNILKVIGEISPDATWVKEGDEFDKDEIRKVYGVDVVKECRGGSIKHTVTFISKPSTDFATDLVEDWADSDPNGQNYGYSLKYDATKTYIYSVKIKGPCGHFH